MCQVYRLTVFILVIAYGGTALGQCDCGELFCSPDYQPCADTEVMSLNETVAALTEELATLTSEKTALEGEVSTLTADLAQSRAKIDEQSLTITRLVAVENKWTNFLLSQKMPVKSDGGQALPASGMAYMAYLDLYADAPGNYYMNAPGAILIGTVTEDNLWQPFAVVRQSWAHDKLFYGPGNLYAVERGRTY